MVFNKFKDKNKPNSPRKSASQQSNAPIRVRTPRNNEVLGKVEQRVGGNRMIVSCFDSKSRNCRIPGKLRKRLWIREGNIVLITPWEFDETKGDIIFKYTNAQITWLKRKGFLKEIENEF